MLPVLNYDNYGFGGRTATLKKNGIELKLGIFSVFVCRAHRKDSTVPQPQKQTAVPHGVDIQVSHVHLVT